jgi:hypothetical protein
MHRMWVITQSTVATKSFFRNTVYIDTHTRMSIHPYEYTHAHPTPMSTSERLSRLDLEIHKVGHQERLAVDVDVASH